MVLSKYRFQVNICWLFILIAMPLNFFYNYFFVKGFLPQIPGVGYPIFGHLLLFAILYVFIVNFKNFYEIKKPLLILLVFLIYCFVWSVLHLMYSLKYAGDFSVFNQSFVALIYIFAFCIVFSYYYDYGSIIFKFLFILMFFVALAEMDFSFIIPFSFDNIAGTEDGHINYQLVSWFMLATWFMFYFKENNIWMRIFSVFIVLFLLLISGGRSELVGFLLSGVSTLIVYSIFSRKKYQKFFIISLLIVVLIYFPIYLYHTYGGFFENSRHMQLLDYENSSSWQEREYIYKINLQNIVDNPLIGAYGSHFELGPGAYIHNILSAWQQFGLLGFILYILIVISPFFISIFYLFKDRDKFNIYPFFFISIYILILSIATKPVFWPYAAMSMGMLFAYMKFRKE
ncbi:O-antigen ligase family protein [Acinetobacter vivianii]|uniref:O-antigen ligase family protein n=1 Tax=Acinetobacter vivianii TaxID=1776742 RepID=A0AAJ6NIP8_9GAMM|nr:O-antigen ligase family protein [Acinetobacter vivianii]WDZ51157.1 O-antigen ligase family protein [Acinetobacter vivianii]